MINISETPDTLDQEAFRLLFPLHLAIKELQSEVTSTSAGSNSQQVYTYIAGEDIAAGKLVALQLGNLLLASRSKGITAMGIATSSALKGEEVNVLMLGFITTGVEFPSSIKYLYLGDQGNFSTIPASSGQMHQQVATVTGASKIHFFPLTAIRRR